MVKRFYVFLYTAAQYLLKKTFTEIHVVVGGLTAALHRLKRGMCF